MCVYIYIYIYLPEMEPLRNCSAVPRLFFVYIPKIKIDIYRTNWLLSSITIFKSITE